jgi:hypothetical protein
LACCESAELLPPRKAAGPSSINHDGPAKITSALARNAHKSVASGIGCFRSTSGQCAVSRDGRQQKVLRLIFGARPAANGSFRPPHLLVDPILHVAAQPIMDFEVPAAHAQAEDALFELVDAGVFDVLGVAVVGEGGEEARESGVSSAACLTGFRGSARKFSLHGALATPCQSWL